tara:strand:+ start:362 stop:637 length:276 start_codon:yes stop_codon:yes gene_type:complete
MNKKEKRQKSILPGAVGVKVVSYQKKNHKTGKMETISDINHALRSFKKELKESGKMEELRERRYYIPKSAKRREQMQRAKYFQWVSDQNNN